MSNFCLLAKISSLGMMLATACAYFLVFPDVISMIMGVFGYGKSAETVASDDVENVVSDEEKISETASKEVVEESEEKKDPMEELANLYAEILLLKVVSDIKVAKDAPEKVIEESEDKPKTVAELFKICEEKQCTVVDVYKNMTLEEMLPTYAELLFLDYQRNQIKEKIRKDALKSALVTEETEMEPETEKTKKDSVSGKPAETAASGENVVVPDAEKEEEKVAGAVAKKVIEESGDKEKIIEELESLWTTRLKILKDLKIDIEDPANANIQEEDSGKNVVMSDEGKDEEEVAGAAPEEILCEVKVKTGYVSVETKDIPSDSDETIEISYDSEDSDDKVDISQCNEKDIKLVMEKANVTRSQAVKALLRNNNQCGEASMELIIKKGRELLGYFSD